MIAFSYSAPDFSNVGQRHDSDSEFNSEVPDYYIWQYVDNAYNMGS